MSTPTVTPSSTTPSDVTRDNFIPIFTNKTEHYKEWRQRIQLYYKKMVLLNKKKEATINLLTSLTGIAWRQIEHVSDKLCDDDDGFGKAIKMLDACFQYDERVEMPRALEKFFYQLQRRPDQTLLAYTSEHREQLREIEKYDIKLPASVSGWLMLRRSALTPEQRQMVQSQCGTSLDITKVEAAMFFLFGQDYRNRQTDGPSRWTGGKGQNYRRQKKHYAYNTYDYDWDGEIDYDQVPDEAYALDDEDTFQYDWEDDGAYFNAEDDTPWPEDETEPVYNAQDDGLDDDDFDEVYATYLDARRLSEGFGISKGPVGSPVFEVWTVWALEFWLPIQCQQEPWWIQFTHQASQDHWGLRLHGFWSTWGWPAPHHAEWQCDWGHLCDGGDLRWPTSSSTSLWHHGQWC